MRETEDDAEDRNAGTEKKLAAIRRPLLLVPPHLNLGHVGGAQGTTRQTRLPSSRPHHHQGPLHPIESTAAPQCRARVTNIRPSASSRAHCRADSGSRQSHRAISEEAEPLQL